MLKQGQEGSDFSIKTSACAFALPNFLPPTIRETSISDASCQDLHDVGFILPGDGLLDAVLDGRSARSQLLFVLETHCRKSVRRFKVS